VTIVPRESFQDELDALRSDVVGMGEDVLDQLDAALAALETGEPSRAETVVGGDEAINERYLALEARCVDLFALQQPVAGDLRFVAAAFKILTDLERVGDLAVNLGQYALATGGGPDSSAEAVELPPQRVMEIAKDARAMLADAIDAFAEEDADACFAIAERDDDLDVLCQHAGETVVRHVLAAGSGGVDAPGGRSLPPGETAERIWDAEEALEDVSRVLLTIRDLERVGDHAVNVAGRTLYALEHDPALLV